MSEQDLCQDDPARGMKFTLFRQRFARLKNEDIVGETV